MCLRSLYQNISCTVFIQLRNYELIYFSANPQFCNVTTILHKNNQPRNNTNCKISPLERWLMVGT